MDFPASRHIFQSSTPGFYYIVFSKIHTSSNSNISLLYTGEQLIRNVVKNRGGYCTISWYSFAPYRLSIVMDRHR